MEKQQSTPGRSVLLAGLILVLAVAGFGAAFYYLDGMSYVNALVSGELFVTAQDPEPPSSSNATDTAGATELQLPSGMPETFALRLWQEQVDSQPMIERLVNGDIKALRITSAKEQGDESLLQVTVVFADDTSAPGVIGMRKFGDDWYVAYASAERDGKPAPIPDSELPTTADVDVALLNTMIAEQSKSASITAEYASGKVSAVEIGQVKPGPSTSTVALNMDEDHEYSSADLIAIEKDMDGEKMWFLARFNKTGSQSQ